ncbi:tetratricopeptide repeat protein [Stappia sp. F7233]|uniref:Tetratricopeptide repeat protein n=1 Tax=Stappia albiluteola TaxID=2758565 RepID=A0A839AAP1_9HYPH|nr:tetratricopeptide repeat protein [Stappia albiluteola]MBA5776012.1 tetratricopeptide repeat protein [Stappia albiluteola]
MQNPELDKNDRVPGGVPSADDVRAQLERILASPAFTASIKRRAFLRFIVEETLSGRAGRLKGFSVAVAVFSRDESFDSQADPVVRFEARRLRRDLDSHYMGAGSKDPVRISIPKGSYVPQFEWLENEQLSASIAAGSATGGGKTSTDDVSGFLAARLRRGDRAGRRLLVGGLIFASVASAAAGWLLLDGRTGHGRSTAADQVHGPAVVVMPFKALDPTDDSRYLADGISQELTANLMRFPGFRLYARPFGFEVESEPARLGQDLGVTYVVGGSVQVAAANVRIALQLVDAASGRVIWAQAYDRPLTPEALMRIQTEVADEIATILGQPYGILSDNLEKRMTSPVVSSMSSYVCVLRAYSYRRSFLRTDFGPVLACLEEAVRRDPDYSDAWAMLGWLYLDAGRFEYSDGRALQDEYEDAFQAASRAVELDPGSIVALKALSSITHYMGRYEEGERLARKAVELNPYDPDTLAQLGWRLAVRGNFDEGIPILKRAIERSANPPSWYFHLIAVDLYLKGDYDDMLEATGHLTIEGTGLSQAFVAIANGALGNRDATKAALEKMNAFKPLARDPGSYFRRHGATDEIVEALVAGLEKARKVSLNR